MNLKYLLQFYELSHHKTMSDYAKAAGVTSPQVSRMVAELEREFEGHLLVRNKNRSSIEFTEKGQILLERIPIIFNEIRTTKSLIQVDPEKEQGSFDLYTTHFLIDYLICPNLYALKKESPEITLNLYGKEQQISDDEKRHNLSITPYSKPIQGITQVKLATFHVGLWASEKYIERYGEPKHPSDLKRHNFLCFEEKWAALAYPTINWYVDNSVFELKYDHAQVIRSSVGIMKAAESGLGLFSVSKESIDLLGLNFKLILPHIKGPEVTMCFTYPTQWEKYEAVQRIKEFLIHTFDEKIGNG